MVGYRRGAGGGRADRWREHPPWWDEDADDPRRLVLGDPLVGGVCVNRSVSKLMYARSVLPDLAAYDLHHGPD